MRISEISVFLVRLIANAVRLSPLISMRNVVILPHMGTDAMETMMEMSMMAAQNMISGLRRDKEMLAEVNLA